MRLMDYDNKNSSLGNLLPWLIEAKDLCFVVHLPTWRLFLLLVMATNNFYLCVITPPNKIVYNIVMVESINPTNQTLFLH
jgi:hypothetical protein